MKRSLKLAASGLALTLASTAASAQTVSRSITVEPVETTVTETPSGTIVTRRPMAQEPAPLVAPQVAAPVLAPPIVPAATFVDTAPETVDTFTTRQVVRRAEAANEVRRLVTRPVAAQRQPARRATTAVRQRTPMHQTTRVVRTTTREVALTRPSAPRAWAAERQIIYRTIAEREVIPRQQVIVAPGAAPAPAFVAPAPAVVGARVLPSVVAAEETVVTAPIPVGTVLPPNVPLYAMPQNVALTVPAAQPYSYAWLGGRALSGRAGERDHRGGCHRIALRPEQSPAVLQPGIEKYFDDGIGFARGNAAFPSDGLFRFKRCSRWRGASAWMEFISRSSSSRRLPAGWSRVYRDSHSGLLSRRPGSSS